MNKLCPGCNTAYNVAAADIGREFSCFKCNAALVVRKDGIRLANAPAVVETGVLAAAAVGYLRPVQPPIRRVVGAIVIVAEVLLIFIKFVTRTS